VPGVEDDHHGSVGRTGAFAFDAGLDPDVAGYRWGWTDQPTTYVAAPSPGAPVTLSLTPPAVRRYPFRVGAGSGVTGGKELSAGPRVENSGVGEEPEHRMPALVARRGVT
jgi:hypothetical protein